MHVLSNVPTFASSVPTGNKSFNRGVPAQGLLHDLASSLRRPKVACGEPRAADAGWLLACRVLLNLDEFITRE